MKTDHEILQDFFKNTNHKIKINMNFKTYAITAQKCALRELKDKLKGKNVVLAFYPKNWIPVCGDQETLYNEMLKYFKKYNAELLGISVDRKACHGDFMKNRKLYFSLLAGFNPGGYTKKRCDVNSDKEGQRERELLSWKQMALSNSIYHLPAHSNLDSIIEALETITNKKIC